MSPAPLRVFVCSTRRPAWPEARTTSAALRVASRGCKYSKRCHVELLRSHQSVCGVRNSLWSLAAGLNLLSAREVRNGPIRRTHFDARAWGIQDDISRSTCGKKYASATAPTQNRSSPDRMRSTIRWGLPI